VRSVSTVKITEYKRLRSEKVAVLVDIMKKRMGMKTALVTGSNKGIGFIIARQLAEAGFRAVVSGRRERKRQSGWRRMLL
jgi:nitrogenase molybdenum-iron protein alpha/beta subunit